MQKPITTKVHGVLDYMTAGLLFTLPRAMGWSPTVTRLLGASALGAVAYSLLTRYELGAIKALPMKAHLTLDAISGGMLVGAAALLEDEDDDVRATLGALGAYEIGAALLSQTQAESDRIARQIRPAPPAAGCFVDASWTGVKRVAA
jgi:hypothetical protein